MYININITIKLKLKYSAQPISHIHQTGAVGLSSLKKTFFKKVYSIKGGKDLNRIFVLMNVSRQSNEDKYYLQWPLEELVLLALVLRVEDVSDSLTSFQISLCP